jgi:threonine/homoserine/homoserine lactone efflux protein
VDVLSLNQVLGFGMAALILIVIPGPSVLFAISRAVVYGRRVALASVVGNTLGLFVVMTLVAVGLGTVVAQSVVVFTVLKLAGAGYLIWLGVQAFRHRGEMQFSDASHRAAQLGWRDAARQGLVVGVSNPKAFMIFAAVLPPFVATDRGAIPLQMFLLGMIAVATGLVCDTAWALVAARARGWFVRSPRRAKSLGSVGGTSMIGLGVGMALSGQHH